VLRWKRLLDNKAGSQEGFISEDVDEKITVFQSLKTIRPLQSRYTYLDSLLDGGFHKGQMYIFAGRLGTGKTRVMMNLVYNLAVLNQHRGIFFNFEMRKLNIDAMFFSMYTGLNQHDITSGGVSDDVFENKWKEIEQLKVQLNIIEKVGVDKTIEFIAGKIAEYKKRMPLDFIALDYIQLLEMAGYKPSEKTLMLGRIAEELKDLAVSENIVVLSTAQTNREQKNGEEFDSAYIGSSDKIGQVADFICGIERINDANAIKLSIVKNRWGMCKKTIFTMDWATNQMTEVAGSITK
jgi:replicative DNA helicase